MKFAKLDLCVGGEIDILETKHALVAFFVVLVVLSTQMTIIWRSLPLEQPKFAF